MAQKKTELSENDKSLIYTPGRGRNTWSVYFWGRDENDKPINFIYRLNISSLPFGLRYLKMYDSVFAIVPPGEDMLFTRDYAEIRKKKILKFDELFFEGNLSKLQGNTDLIDLACYLSGAFADVAMDQSLEEKFIARTEAGPLHKKHENIQEEILMPRMDCQGMAGIRRKDRNIKGISWFEKKYVEFPKGKIPQPTADTIKINLVPEETDQVITIFSITDGNAEESEKRLSLLTPGEPREDYESEEFSLEETGSWVSPHTDIEYPVKWNLDVPDLELKIDITADRDDQEVYTVSNKVKVGEYVGLGTFSGTCGGEPFSGVCSIETAVNSAM